ncbi:ATP-dependent DNA helicase RecG [Gordonia sp. NB41Y]|uniref:ATP-dependent DNA helicase RecG n=1 Tax=Gordonia sp. NB41Y TaxID=875808 RepID=UPI0002BD6370|nr:ATP-dependent DNA helicase RecG [Gordonia sp. NB41Y]EMP13305.1 ATP-dependent DNA helicase RecG [Gordonia sp. NB41Y]WLP90163.1 ATP-dependent DNA helicase RecG [Gordonia sp. NB41Y]
MVALTDPLEEILGPKMTEGLGTLGVHTVGDLLRYAPRRYLHRGQASAGQELEEGEWITVVGRIGKSQMIPMKRRHGKFLKVTVSDEKHVYEASFFNAWAIQNALKPGVRVMMAGAIKLFRGTPQLTHPQWMVLPEPDAELEKIVGSPMMAEMYALEFELTGANASKADAPAPNPMAQFERPILPMYPANRTCQTWEIWSAVRRVLDLIDTIPDPLDDAERAERGLMDADTAIRTVHLPERESEIEPARERMKFDEALAIQLVLAQRRVAGRGQSGPACPHVPGGLEDRLREKLPFTLTDGQETVLAEIADDLATTEPMSRLLQGEVGSGKTLVSLLAMLRVVDNGHQCALLAPTEVLAAQHYRTITTQLGELGKAEELGAADGATAVALFTGSMRTKDKRETLLDVVTGKAGIVIGTHALLEENVSFFDLGMVVVDEQHRFGVEQRDVLRRRGRDGVVPHVLVMTATPIPRTVAMTAFGDLDTSVLAELPRGRQPISSSVVPLTNQKWVDRTWERVAEEIADGRQIYVVCSRIGDEEQPKKGKGKGAKKSGADDPEMLDMPDLSDDPEVAEVETTSVLDQYENLLAGPLGGSRIAMLHGRMPAEDKADVMDAFGREEIDILVSTTVIEVGVDVHNATMMIIVDAERFGVSQLHQLRGRVGRGGHPGLCLLMTRSRDGSPTLERLKAVAASNDGFELARIDLQQRREGDVLGSLQSGGTSSLRFLSLLDDADILADAQVFARGVVDGDAELLGRPALAGLVDAVLAPNKIRYLDKS